MLETNPQMQQMMQSMMSNPAMMDMALRANPQLRAMIEANPQMASMLQNPQLVQSMMNPQMLRAVGQAQQQVSSVFVILLPVPMYDCASDGRFGNQSDARS
jgi:hypothetical protein